MDFNFLNSEELKAQFPGLWQQMQAIGDAYSTGALSNHRDSSGNLTRYKSADDLEKGIKFLKKAIEVADDDVNPYLSELIRKQLDSVTNELAATNQMNDARKAMYFKEAGELIAIAEENLFTGAFSEDKIEFQLRTHHDKQVKRDYYNKTLNEMKNDFIEVLEAVRREQSWDSMLIGRCEKCINQANKLLDILRSG